MSEPHRPRRSATRVTAAITARECRAAFGSPIAWVAAAAFSGLANALFMNQFFLRGVLDLSPWFDRLPLLLAITVPALTMRSFAEERRQRTLEFLMTLPVQSAEVWIGKCLSVLAQIALLTLSVLPLVVLLRGLGDLDLGPVLAGVVGTLSLGFLLTSLGMYCSARTEDQVVAYVLAALLGTALLLIGEPRFVEVLDGWAPNLGAGTFLARTLSPLPRFERSVEGAVELSSLLYHFAFGTWFLVLGAVGLNRRRS